MDEAVPIDDAVLAIDDDAPPIDDDTLPIAELIDAIPELPSGASPPSSVELQPTTSPSSAKTLLRIPIAPNPRKSSHRATSPAIPAIEARLRQSAIGWRWAVPSAAACVRRPLGPLSTLMTGRALICLALGVLTACGGDPQAPEKSASDDPPTKAAEKRKAKPKKKNKKRKGGRKAKANDDEVHRPSVKASLPADASRKVKAKTRKVMEQAADPNAGKAESKLSNEHPKLIALKEAAKGKALTVPEHALDGFFAALDRTQADGDGDDVGVARVVHIGDSFIGQDVFPHAIRKLMQARFGDAGPGFQLVDLDHRSNVSRALDLRSEHWNTCSIRQGCLGKDGWYGYAGHLARGGAGATAWLEPRNPESFRAGKGFAELWYQKHDRGGRIELETGGKKVITVDTKADERSDAWETVKLAGDDYHLALKVRGPGRGFAYGVSFETGTPGVIWDAVIMSGAFTKRLRGFDKEHAAAQLAHRKLDLLVFNFGGNDLRRVAKRGVSPEELQKELEEGIDLLRGANEKLSCIVVSSTDHAKSGKTPITPRAMKGVVNAQRGAAESRGCAFMDAFEVFGGLGKAEKLAKRKPVLVAPDLSHLTSLGRHVLAEVMVAELMRFYEAYQSSGAEEPAAAPAPADEGEQPA